MKQRRGIGPWFVLFGALFVWSPTFGTTEPTVFPALAARQGWVQASQAVIVASFVVSALVLAAFGQRLLAPGRRPKTIAAASCATAAGMLAGCAAALGAPAWLMPLGSALRGLPFCFLVAAWLEALAALDGREAGAALFGALALYAALGVCIPALSARSAMAAAAVMVALPLASGWGSLHATRDVEPRKPAARGVRSSLSSTALYAAINVAYGFSYGVMLYDFSRLGNAFLYGSFGAFSLVGVMFFAFYRKMRDVGFAFRAYIVTAPLLLLGTALSGSPEAVAVSEAGIWAVTVFFTIIIFTDSEFSSGTSPWRMAGIALALAGCGILAGLALMAAGPAPAMASLPLMAATLAAMLTLSAMFLPNGITDVNPWGFSSFLQHESREAFLERRCAEITARYQLTPRELDVLRLLAQGRTNDEVSEALVISPLTAKTHVRNIYGKLDVHDRGELLELVEGGGEPENAPGTGNGPS